MFQYPTRYDPQPYEPTAREVAAMDKAGVVYSIRRDALRALKAAVHAVEEELAYAERHGHSDPQTEALRDALVTLEEGFVVRPEDELVASFLRDM